jgi:hypothetical protein
MILFSFAFLLLYSRTLTDSWEPTVSPLKEEIPVDGRRFGAVFHSLVLFDITTYILLATPVLLVNDRALIG